MAAVVVGERGVAAWAETIKTRYGDETTRVLAAWRSEILDLGDDAYTFATSLDLSGVTVSWGSASQRHAVSLPRLSRELTPGRCSPHAGYGVLDSTNEILLTRRDLFTEYGDTELESLRLCLRKTGADRLIAQLSSSTLEGDFEAIDAISLSGHFAAVATQSDTHYGDETADVGLFDAPRGKQTHFAVGPPSSDYQNQWSTAPIAVSSRGDLAWVTYNANSMVLDLVPAHGTQRQIDALGAPPERLDGLRFSTGVLHWRHNGEPRTAPLGR